MKLFRIYFKLGKHDKATIKGGTSAADAFGKVCLDFRRAQKTPVFARAEVLEDYGEHPPVSEEDARSYLATLSRLRERVLLEEDYTGVPGSEYL